MWEQVIESLTLVILLRLTGASLPPVLGRQWLRCDSTYVEWWFQFALARWSSSATEDPGSIADASVLLTGLNPLRDQWHRYLRRNGSMDAGVSTELCSILERFRAAGFDSRTCKCFSDEQWYLDDAFRKVYMCLRFDNLFEEASRQN